MSALRTNTREERKLGETFAGPMAANPQECGTEPGRPGAAFGFDASENAKATMLLTGVEQASPNFDENRGEKNRQVGNLLSIRVAARTLY